MMNKQFKLSLICASILALTACNDDDTVTIDPNPDLEVQIAELTEQNQQLDEANKDLTEANLTLADANEELDGKAASFVSTFQEQCANIGVNFEYENPNPDSPYVNNGKSPEASLIGVFGMPEIPFEHNEGSTCTSCHTDGHDSGMACDTCHSFAAEPVEPTDPVEPVDPTDPGAPDMPTHPADGNWDSYTGASNVGTFYYNADGASFVNAAFLETRMGKQNTFYEWKEAAEGEGVATLKTACGLENREFITHEYPEDGKSYTLNSYSNFKGASTFTTFRMEEGTPIASSATFGPGMSLEDDGEYYIDLFITKNNTCKNLITNGRGEVHYYEYDTRSNVKKGSPDMGPRNAGARIQVTADLHKSVLKSFDWFTPVYGADGQSFDPQAVDWDTVGSCDLKLKVQVIYPLG
ncbi:hypothetical protein [uncultured Shewanella sp.]|uniref:hypothetical protein n=2 Tax=Shewanella TaxID=22 RepID=UPI00262A561A|nr:hypothetical protein [uncultured Shewanella sp.]